MDKKLFISLIFLLFLGGCNDAAKNGSNLKVGITNEKDGSYKNVFSDGDYNFQIEYSNRLDTSYFDVIYKGKKVDRKGYTGKIENSFLADLNRDKKNEVYLEMKDESSSKLFGYFLKDGQAVNIAIAPPKHLSNVKKSTYRVERNQLIGLYQSLTKDKKIVSHESRFNLVESGEEYVLLPQGWQPGELLNMIGHYVSKNVSNPDYYKSMVLGKRDGGKWKVVIEVKQTSDKKVVCEFTGTGEFIDKDLFVPLNQENPTLKGTLQIRFLGMMAAVYSEEQENSKELISFCPERGSIAGNFKKMEI